MVIVGNLAILGGCTSLLLDYKVFFMLLCVNVKTIAIITCGLKNGQTN